MTQPPLWPDDWTAEPDPARWIHVSHVDPEEAAFLDLHGEPYPPTTITFHTPELCCDRAKYH